MDFRVPGHENFLPSGSESRSTMQLLERLCNLPGVSGYEHEVQAVVWDELKHCADEVWRDRVGNVIALKRGSGGRRLRNRDGAERPIRLLYAAHADEIGMMVSHIDEEGFLRFRAIGGLDPRTLVSERVVVHGTRGGERKLHGVIGPQAGWLGTPEDRKRVFPIDELYIDLALPSSEVCSAVEIGDIVTLAAEFAHLNERVVVGRNFDDRMGVYCLIEAMKRIEHAPVDVYAVSTVQEEVGVRGVPTAAHAIEPDVALAIDGSLPGDTPYARPDQRQSQLGKGTGIYLMDNRTIGNAGLVRTLITTCESHGISYQRNLGGGTDASEIQRRGYGAWATTIGAPTRYMHSTVQLCHLDDVEATIALLSAFPKMVPDMLPTDWI
jgi:putative aminopeptidase FrvX